MDYAERMAELRESRQAAEKDSREIAQLAEQLAGDGGDTTAKLAAALGSAVAGRTVKLTHLEEDLLELENALAKVARQRPA